MPEINGISLPFLPANGTAGLERKSIINAPTNNNQGAFEALFNKELSNLKFSGHAKSRIENRDIALTEKDMLRLENALSKAEQKGATEALIMLDEKAFILNVPNSTVITVIDRNNMDGNVITNIDTAVFA